jgi:hypothetical protein
LNLQLQRQHCSRLEAREFLNRRKIIVNLKTRHAINSAVIFYNTGVVTRDRRIGSCFSAEAVKEADTNVKIGVWQTSELETALKAGLRALAFLFKSLKSLTLSHVHACLATKMQTGGQS